MFENASGLVCPRNRHFELPTGPCKLTLLTAEFMAIAFVFDWLKEQVPVIFLCFPNDREIIEAHFKTKNTIELEF